MSNAISQLTLTQYLREQKSFDGILKLQGRGLSKLGPIQCPVEAYRGFQKWDRNSIC